MKFLEIEWKGETYKLWAKRNQNKLWIHYKGGLWSWHAEQTSVEKLKKKKKILKGLILSSMPGKINEVPVKKGDEIQEGQTLLVMSAMKIEYTFRAEAEGLVEDVYCEVGQTVSLHQQLLKVNYVSS